MPQYEFEHPDTKKRITLIQKMNDTHEFTDEKGVKWIRIFYSPNASIDNEINPFSKQDFLNKTNNKKGTVGDLWDLSAELSDKRAKLAGKDLVKEKAIQDYKNKTTKDHPHAPTKELKHIEIKK